MSERTPDEPDLDFTPEHDEPDDDLDATSDSDFDDLAPMGSGADEAAVPAPINWRLLGPEDAEHEWLTLNEWVHWLRVTFGLPASVVPPFWHRHPELVWELSALHLHWLAAYHPSQHASAPIGWMADFHAAQQRLRDWVAATGTRLDRDRETRQTTWPGEEPAPSPREERIEHREKDFVAHVLADVRRRAEAEKAFLRGEDDG